jgi:hypothetical protein
MRENVSRITHQNFMSWRPISISNVRLTPTELAVMANISGAVDVGGEILLTVVGEFIGALQATGNPYTLDGTIPDILRQHVINRTRWLWLAEFPTLKNSQTADRKALNEEAVKFRDTLMETGRPRIEPPPVPAADLNLVALPKIKPSHRHMRREQQEGL